MELEADPPPRRIWRWWLVGHLLLMLAYPLSAGPAVWLWFRTTSPIVRQAMEHIYNPLDRALQQADQLPPLRVPLRWYAWYVDLWRPNYAGRRRRDR